MAHPCHLKMCGLHRTVGESEAQARSYRRDMRAEAVAHQIAIGPYRWVHDLGHDVMTAESRVCAESAGVFAL